MGVGLALIAFVGGAAVSLGTSWVLVTRVERPVRAARGHEADADADVDVDLPPEDEEPEDEIELIDESESEAAPAAID